MVLALLTAGVYPDRPAIAAATASSGNVQCPPGWTIPPMPTLNNTDNAFEAVGVSPGPEVCGRRLPGCAVCRWCRHDTGRALGRLYLDRRSDAESQFGDSELHASRGRLI